MAVGGRYGGRGAGRGGGRAASGRGGGAAGGAVGARGWAGSMGKDLQIVAVPVLRVESPSDPVDVGKDQCVVRGHRRDAPRAGRHPREGQPYQERHLFLGAA